MDLNDLWTSSDAKAWWGALDSYWERVPDHHVELEKRMDRLNVAELERMDPAAWFEFLDQEYFPWKYTAANRLATCRRWLKQQANGRDGLGELDGIRRRLLGIEKDGIAVPLHIAGRIGGLGVAGASGLLSLMYPEHFCTLDRFLVENLRSVRADLPELAEMEPDQLTGLDGVILTDLVRRKAHELSTDLGEQWTPRMVDKVLWAVRPDRS